MLMAGLWITGPFTAGGCGDDGGGGNDNESQAVCGDGVMEGAEACDGSELGGLSCVELGWNLGELACAADCSLDVSACVGGGPECGNWTAEWGEECDTGDLAGATCESIGFAAGAGTLACRRDCTFDPSGCGPPPDCGNQVIDAPEECDGPDLGGQSCESRGYLGGDLGCGANCVLDESRCTNAECGDGVQEGSEECDGTDLDGHDCVMLGYGGGTLACDEYCLFEVSGCN